MVRNNTLIVSEWLLKKKSDFTGLAHGSASGQRAEKGPGK